MATRLPARAKATTEALQRAVDGVWLYPSYPPSVNGNYRAVAGRVILSAKYRAWKKQAALEYMIAKPPKRISGPVLIDITLRAPDKRRRDIDNPIKALADFLVNVGAIEADDNSIVKALTVRWNEDGFGVPCSIHIRPAFGG